MKRAIKIEGVEDELVISIATRLHVPTTFLNLEELPDKTWRLEFSANLIDDFSRVTALEFQGLSNKRGTRTFAFKGIGFAGMVSRVIAMPTPKSGLRVIWFSGQNGEWHLRYTKELIPNAGDLIRMDVIRDDSEELQPV